MSELDSQHRAYELLYQLNELLDSLSRDDAETVKKVLIFGLRDREFAATTITYLEKFEPSGQKIAKYLLESANQGELVSLMAEINPDLNVATYHALQREGLLDSEERLQTFIVNTLKSENFEHFEKLVKKNKPFNFGKGAFELFQEALKVLSIRLNGLDQPNESK